MSLSGGSGSPSIFPSVNSYDAWITRDFPDDLLAESNYQQPLCLTPEEERLFKSFGDGLDNDLDHSFASSDELDDKQAVYAEAHAAGLFKGGLRRAAFSMGDLEALQPQIPVSTTTRSPPRLPMHGSGGAKAPSLESVPESKALPSLPTNFNDDVMLSTSMPEKMSTDILAGISLDQLSADLSTTAGFEGNAGMSIFSDAMPLRLSQDMSALELGMPVLPVIKSEPGEEADMKGPPLDFGCSMEGLASDAGNLDFGGSFNAAPLQPLNFNFGNYLDGGIAVAAERKPPLPPRSPSAATQTTSSGLKLDGNIMAGSQQTFRDIPSQGGTVLTRSLATSGSHEPKTTRGNAEPPAQKLQKSLLRSQSALELRSMGQAPPSHTQREDHPRPRFSVELTTPEGHTYTAGRLSNEERAQKILRYRQKRHERNFNKRIKYMCRKTLADSRPRVRGRFARNDDAAAVMPHETKKALAEKAKRERKAAEAAAAEILRAHDRQKAERQAAARAAALAASGRGVPSQPGLPVGMDFGNSRARLTSDLSDLIPMSIPHTDSNASLSTTTAFKFSAPEPGPNASG